MPYSLTNVILGLVIFIAIPVLVAYRLSHVNWEDVSMDYQKLFEELKIWLDLAADAKLQAAYQYGVQADELAQLVIKKIKTATLLPVRMTCMKKMNHFRKPVVTIWF